MFKDISAFNYFYDNDSFLVYTFNINTFSDKYSNYFTFVFSFENDIYVIAIVSNEVAKLTLVPRR